MSEKRLKCKGGNTHPRRRANFTFELTDPNSGLTARNYKVRGEREITSIRVDLGARPHV